MSRILMIVALVAMVAMVAVTGCCSSSGSREYIPGQGWVPND